MNKTREKMVLTTLRPFSPINGKMLLLCLKFTPNERKAVTTRHKRFSITPATTPDTIIALEQPHEQNLPYNRVSLVRVDIDVQDKDFFALLVLHFLRQTFHDQQQGWKIIQRPVNMRVL